DQSALAAVAAEMRSAATTSGFFQIVNHPLDADLIRKTFDYSRQFFALPLDSKLAASAHMSGYEPFGNTTVQKGTPPDAKEGFFVMKEGSSLPHMGIAGNVWPTDPSLPPDFKSTILEYWTRVQQLSVQMYRLLALSLELPADYFDRLLVNDISPLRLLHYPPTPQDALGRQKGIGAHTDYGGLTLLVQDSVGGLQIHPTGYVEDDEAWQDVPPVVVEADATPAIVCNIGDFIQLWTNGLYKSTMHRVINRSGKDRYSMAFLSNMDLDIEVEPIEKC
ncbi:2OG-Fe(II) oxygenase, partial [Gonapodya prolifera JEL478]